MSMTRLFGMRHLHADRRRQAVAHRAEAARRHPPVRFLEPEELRRPHLVLADLGGDVDVPALGRGVQPLDRVLRHDDVGVLPIGEASGAPASGRSRPTTPSAPPCRLLGFSARQTSEHLLEHLRHVADDRDVDVDVLVDRRRVDIDVVFLEPGENASSRPVMRSSKRAPTLIITSQSCMALLAS